MSGSQWARQLSDRIGIAIQVGHFRLGTSKWNKIEHRMFSLISITLSANVAKTPATRKLLSRATRGQFTMLEMCKKQSPSSVIDRRNYPTGTKVSEDDFETINIHPDPWHGDWNYVIKPSTHRP